MIKQYQRKPTIVEAIQYTGSNGTEISKWSDGKVHGGTPDGVSGLVIQGAINRTMVVHGDWVVKSLSGEFFPCKPGVFEIAYEEFHIEED